jgi:hypothetical protein
MNARSISFHREALCAAGPLAVVADDHLDVLCGCDPAAALDGGRNP